MGQSLLNRHLLRRWTFLILFFSSSQIRQMQSSLLRVPHLPGRCERQVLLSVFWNGRCLGKSSVLAETTINCVCYGVPSRNGRQL